MHGWIREYDKTRYVQYESGNPKSNISDVICPMYPTMSWLTDVMADDSDLRPFIMCEYAYAKSNSNGNFKEFWDYVNKYPRFQGGFIWDFADKAIAIHEEDGNIKYGYGGAFGEDVTDPVPDMCLNGVVFADLSYKPGAYEVRNGQSPVTIEQVKIHIPAKLYGCWQTATIPSIFLICRCAMKLCRTAKRLQRQLSGILHGSRNNRDASASGASGTTAWRGVCKLLR